MLEPPSCDLCHYPFDVSECLFAPGETIFLCDECAFHEGLSTHDPETDHGEKEQVPVQPAFWPSDPAGPDY